MNVYLGRYASYANHPTPPPHPGGLFYCLAVCASHLRSSTLERTPFPRSIHPSMTVGSGALTVLCAGIWTIICLATQKTSEIKLPLSFEDPHLGILNALEPPTSK